MKSIPSVSLKYLLWNCTLCRNSCHVFIVTIEKIFHSHISDDTHTENPQRIWDRPKEIKKKIHISPYGKCEAYKYRIGWEIVLFFIMVGYLPTLIDSVIPESL